MLVLVLIFALLALATVATVTLPLLRPAHAVADRGQFDRAVYRDQLKELDRDFARGVLSEAEVQSARLEIQRRLLAATGRSGAALRAGRSPLGAAGVAAFVLILAGVLYARLGSPALPDMPFASRTDNPAVVQSGNHLDMRDAAAKLYLKLQKNPDDADGWVLYGRTESTLRNWDSAKDAYAHAMKLGRAGPDVLASYGEMMVLAEQDIVSPAARQAFTRVLRMEPTNAVARYYLALADAQAGDVKRAIAAWSSLAADVPQDSSMRQEIEHRVADAAQSAGMAVPSLPRGKTPQRVAAAPAGPDEATLNAAAQMPPGQREQMIRGMVAQLAAKMQSDPNNLEGWLRLGRAYVVLGERNRAVAAFQHAAALDPNDVTPKLGQVEALLAGLKPADTIPPRAVTLLHAVQKVSPDQPEALWYLGIVATRDGQPAQARAYWTRLLKQLPANGPEAKMVHAALAAVNGK